MVQARQPQGLVTAVPITVCHAAKLKADKQNFRRCDVIPLHCGHIREDASVCLCVRFLFKNDLLKP